LVPLLPLVRPAPAGSHGLEREQQHGESGISSLLLSPDRASYRPTLAGSFSFAFPYHLSWDLTESWEFLLLLYRVLCEKHSVKKGVCRVPKKNTQQRRGFAECFFLALSKEISFFSLLTFKLFLLCTYNMWYSMLNFGIFLDLLAIFN